MAQTWNDILGAVKRKLGANLNLLELSDDEIIDGLKSDVMPYISQYSPFKKFLKIDSSHHVSTIKAGEHRWKYKLPLDPDEYLIDVYEVYSRGTTYGEHYDDPFEGTKYESGNIRGSISAYGSGSTDMYGGGMIDLAIVNSYLDAAYSMMARNTWEFYPPDIVAFDMRIVGAVVVYNIAHQSPDTMMPDIYHTMFKPYCIGSVCEWLSAIRSKYENVSTPFGQINVNWQKLEQDAEKLKQEAQQRLDMLPPDKFVSVHI